MDSPMLRALETARKRLLEEMWECRTSRLGTAQEKCDMFPCEKVGQLIDMDLAVLKIEEEWEREDQNE